MAVRNAAKTNQSNAAETTGDGVEQKVVALAEQLGWFLGTVRAKADGWLDREALRKEVGRIRDGAADLLAHVNRASTVAQKAAAKPAAAKKTAAKSAAVKSAVAKPAVAKPAAASPMRASRGAVDAPGKRHRKPPPQEPIDRRMGEPVGKQMGQKSVKSGMRRGRQ